MSTTPPRQTQSRIATLCRSCAVGVVATAVDLGSLFLLVHVFGCPAELANVPTLIPGLLVQFFGNKFFAFRDHSPQLRRQGSLFALVEAGAFVLNVIVFHLIVTLTAVHYLAARMLGTGLVYLGFSFPLWGLIFRETPHVGASASAPDPSRTTPGTEAQTG
ncbi:MAG: GtrA family protein [Gemmataceae bacterium]|nr:GtrA family protein [Gemmataceae bacterium]